MTPFQKQNLEAFKSMAYTFFATFATEFAIAFLSGALILANDGTLTQAALMSVAAASLRQVIKVTSERAIESLKGLGGGSSQNK